MTGSSAPIGAATNPLPLVGIRVIDFSWIVVGPSPTQSSRPEAHLEKRAAIAPRATSTPPL